MRISWLLLLMFLAFRQIGFSQNNFTIAVDSCKALHADSNILSFLSPEHLSCLTGAPMPKMSVQTINKENIQLPHPKAKTHVLFFWHLSCDPCLGLLEGLDRLKMKYEYQGVEFISFTTDTPNAIVEDFHPYYTFNWPIIPNAFEITKESFALSWGYPTIMIFDNSNQLFKIDAGAVNEPEVVQKIIEDLSSAIKSCLKK